MASWLINVAEDLPEHVDFAIEQGFWDLTRNRNIRSGDLVYFWLSGTGLVARGRVMADVYPIDGQSPRGRWKDDSEDRYPYRIDIAAEKTGDLAGVPWTRVVEFIGDPTRKAHTMPFAVHGAVEARLAALFDEDLPGTDDGPNEAPKETDQRIEKYRMVR